MEESERAHLLEVLEKTSAAVKQQDATALRELSNQSIHSASYVQDGGSITLAVLVYALSKLIERNDHLRIRRWARFVVKLQGFLRLAADAAQKNNQQAYEQALERARTSLSGIALNLKPYIRDVLHKASINKASRIYEHGISLGKTAQLLGITRWELADYVAQRRDDARYHTLSIEKRAQLALEFFA